MEDHIRDTFELVRSEGLTFLEDVAEKAGIIEILGSEIDDTTEGRQECRKIVKDAILMAYLAIQHCLDAIGDETEGQASLERKVEALVKALDRACIFLQEAVVPPEKGICIETGLADVKKSLKSCLTTFEMGEFHHIRGAYRNAKLNLEQGLCRRVTTTKARGATIMPPQESKKAKEHRRHTGAGEDTFRTRQGQSSSRPWLGAERNKVIDVSENESEDEATKPSPSRKTSEDSSSKRNDVVAPPVQRRSSSSSQKLQGKGRQGTGLQKTQIHEEPAEMDAESGSEQEKYRNRHEQKGKHPRSEEERSNVLRRTKTHPVTSRTRQDSTDDQPPPPYQPPVNHPPMNHHHAGYPALGSQYHPGSPTAYAPIFQSPLDVIPHLLSKVTPGMNITIEDSFNTGPAQPKRNNRRNTDGT